MASKDDANGSGITAFNMAIASLKRIDELLRLSNHYGILGIVTEKRRCLVGVYCELYPKLTPSEIKIHEKIMPDINKVDMKIGYSNSNLNQKKGHQEQLNKLGGLLIKWELVLRKHLDTHGLLIPTRDDPSFAVLG